MQKSLKIKQIGFAVGFVFLMYIRARAMWQGLSAETVQTDAPQILIDPK